MAIDEMKRICFLAAVISLQLIYCTGTTDTKFRRDLTSIPMCRNTPGQDATHIIHTFANGTDDELHYLFSTFGVPTILVIRTGHKASLKVDCKLFFGNTSEMVSSVSAKDQRYAYAIMFNRLLEYNDTDDLADLDQVKPDAWRVHDLDKMTWDDLYESSDVNRNIIVFTLHDQPDAGLSFRNNGSLKFAMDVMSLYERELLLPHLEYNANMTSLMLTLDNIITGNFTSARFALELTLVSMDSVPNNMTLKKKQYIDDEHSPGVFEMVNWIAKDVGPVWTGFMQYKPVCYTTPERSLKYATKAFYYDLMTPNETLMQPLPSLALAYFGSGMYSGNFSLTMANISFGITADKFYTKTNFMVWSASIGFGKPPQDEVSVVIIMIVSIGLGLPILLISIGSIGICIRNRRRSSLVYQDITVSSPDIN